MVHRLVAIAVAFSALTRPASAQTQLEMNIQAGTAFHRADTELNALYRDLVAKIDAQGKAALRNAQQAWLKFRDAECDFETRDAEGGSIHPMVMNQCLEDLTRQRNQQLKRQLTCQEGDLTCGGR